MDVGRIVGAVEVDRFQRDGVIHLSGLFEPEWLEAIAVAIEENLAHPSPYAEFLTEEGEDGGFFDDYLNWQRLKSLRDYVYHSPAAAVAGRLMQSSKVSFYHEHVLVKFPGAQKETPWHHDQPYYPVDGDQVCSLWMPLDPVGEEQAMRFIRGSHAWGRRFVPRKFADGRAYAPVDPDGVCAEGFEPLPDIEAEIKRDDILSWSLKPGDCLVFHMLTLHSGPGNPRADRSRRALATRWLGDDARLAARPWETSPPITGGLEVGAPMQCEQFPVVWTAK